ncbi:MAG: penicillin-binding protein 2 [Hyphomonas sp.]|uniref:penicillin-binding protein 2 n=1 Tax=Hyphomonas sp. TaxID=87 RepID=UPI0017D9DDFD|nr:penicillin-binding protein 2 [Hyphomonas sp.]MBU3921499.1 penicillin-binding protein 2 [Alphaproteobacteria bacterium]MBA3069475.1 penicillin-binding protein 2 [Hyphomonas sp.]MBU4063857.1 penicillin-binding protein 2 [Alphaproteobacteria bacterium]MBU4164182.1 penicillin-binding protein 2 [Alphaproteobacteria bacterium]MBU4567369.1 penicillin-binding protein 2 [Alphaproteobacteria bacterium]
MARKQSPDADFDRRLLIMMGVGGAVYATLVGRLSQLQFVESAYYRELAAQNHIRLVLAPPARGQILDRFGRPLASQRQAGRVSVVPERLDDAEVTLARLGKLIDLPDTRRARVLEEIKGNRTRRAGFVPVTVVQELSYEEFARLRVHAVDMEGVDVEMASTRSYPRGRDFAHVLGYVARASADDLTRLAEGRSPEDQRTFEELLRHPDIRVGRQGMERFAEDWLRGRPGRRRVVTNAHGRPMQELEQDPATAAVAGKDLYITIDAELQRVAIERFAGESGAAVVVDVSNGDVLSMVSTPAFDPNAFVNGISGKDYAELRDNPMAPLYPRAHGGVYPPGSTFKMVVATAALESGAVKPTDTVRCNGYYRFGNRTWHCWKKGGHGTMNMHNGIKHSCDVYFYETARRTGVDKIAEVAHKFGFGETFVLGMTGARSGLVPDPEWKQNARGEPWFEGETLNFGIGQGQLGVTPLQLALMTARIAADGAPIKPRLVGLGPESEDEVTLDAPLDKDIIGIMRSGMFGVTSEPGGTGYRSGDLGLGGPRMAGKSGTAQVRRISQAERDKGIRKGIGIERELRDHALFVAYAPTDNPRYAVSVVVEHGESGSGAAAPLARDILAAALKMDSGRTPLYSKRAAATPPGTDQIPEGDPA